MSNQTQNDVPYWRCRLCGAKTPMGKFQCDNPRCKADLSIYGVIESGSDTPATDTPVNPEPVHDTPVQPIPQPISEQPVQKPAAQNIKPQQPTQTTAKKRSKAWIFAIVIPVFAVLVIAGIAAFMFVTQLNSSRSYPTPTSSAPISSSPGSSSAAPVSSSVSETPVGNAWEGNVLMSDAYDNPDKIESPGSLSVLNTPITREQIGTVTFLNSLDFLEDPNAPELCWDVSQAQDGSVMAWVYWNASTNLYELFIAADGGIEAPQDASTLFMGYTNVQEINFNGAFHTENVTHMEFMFSGCSYLQQADFSDFDTAQVTNMDAMFSGCFSLTKLDVSNFDTSSVTSMRWMFLGCSGLTELDVSNFDTSSVTSMSYMFSYCSGLTTLDVSNFDTASVIDMSGMFSECSSLTELDVSSFDTSSVTSMRWMFGNCSVLGELDASKFDTSSVTDMSYMFTGVRDDFILRYSSSTFVTTNVIDYEGFMPDGFDWEKLFS